MRTIFLAGLRSHTDRALAAPSATGSIAITLSKITMLLLRKTLEGQNQLTSPDAIAFALSLLATALLNLKVLNDGLARHEVIQTVDFFPDI